MKAPFPLVPLAGVRLIEDPNLVEEKQVRFPKSKKRRIRKKWTARRKNWRMSPDQTIYRIDANTWACHPVVARDLRRKFETPDVE